MAPTFTLRLTEVPVREYNDRQAMRLRWVVESDHPGWIIPPHSGMGNVNDLDHSDWAKNWASEMVAENSPYTVTAWAHDESTDTWTAELKRIRHDFLIAFTDGETCQVRAKNAANAGEIRDAISSGTTFIEFINKAEDALFVNLAHVFAITYQPVEVDL